MSREEYRLAAKEALLGAESRSDLMVPLATRYLKALLEEVNLYRGQLETDKQEQVKARLALTEAEFSQLVGSRSPTHRCRVCGAYWITYTDSWSLCSKRCGKCCDNEPLADGQLEPLQHTDLLQPVRPTASLDEEPSVEWRSLEQLRVELRAKVEATNALELMSRVPRPEFTLLMDFVNGQGPLSPSLATFLGLELQYGKPARAGWL